MGNYFSRQGDESIKETINISNETDHVHVTVSNATKTGVINTNENCDENRDENRDENNEAVQVVQECLEDNNNNDEIIYKKKLKKRKCKKNKKKHLQ
jgi:hypothetical protein